MEKECDMNIQ